MPTPDDIALTLAQSEILRLTRVLCHADPLDQLVWLEDLWILQDPRPEPM